MVEISDSEFIEKHGRGRGGDFNEERAPKRKTRRHKERSEMPEPPEEVKPAEPSVPVEAPKPAEPVKPDVPPEKPYNREEDFQAFIDSLPIAPPKKLRTGEESKEELARKVAQITLTRGADWKDFAVHGVYGKDKEGNPVVLNFTDLDGKGALALLKLAGFDTSQTKYLSAGANLRGMINIDTGDKHGLIVEDNGKTVFFDHHADDSGRDTSATKLVFDALTAAGLLESNWGIKKMVEFVTQVDNGTYPDSAKKYKSSSRTLYGLRNFIPIEKIIDYFSRGKDPDTPLTDEELKKMSKKVPEGQTPELIKRSQKRQEVIEKSGKVFQELERDGFVIKSEAHGIIVVDVGKKVPGGWEAAQGYGYNTYIIWSPEEQSFFISGDRPLNISFPQGRTVRETMYIKPRGGAPLEEDLNDVLIELTGGRFAKEGGLKEYLEKEAEGYGPRVEIKPEELPGAEIIEVPMVDKQTEKLLESAAEMEPEKPAVLEKPAEPVNIESNVIVGRSRFPIAFRNAIEENRRILEERQRAEEAKKNTP